MPERIVVTGGTGFVGRALVRRFAERGLDVAVLSRGTTLPPELLGLPGVSVVPWDSVTEGDWVRALSGARAVVHLAGERALGRRFTTSLKRRIFDSRVKVAELLVSAMGHVERPPAVLLSASGIDYFAGDTEARAERIDETAPPGTNFLAQVCVAWEHAVAGAAAHGARAVSMRLGAVLGRGGDGLSTMLLPFKLFVGGPLGSGRQLFSWVHLEDVVRAFELALEAPTLSGPVNLVAPNPVTQKELARAIGHKLHRPALFPVPSFVLKLLFGEGAAPIVLGRRAVPAKLEQAGFTFRYPTIEETLDQVVD